MGVKDWAKRRATKGKRWLKGDKSLEKLEGREKYQKMLTHIERMAAKGSEMHQYMSQRFYEYRANGMDFNTAVRKARQGGILHRANEQMKKIQFDIDAARASGDRVALIRANKSMKHWKNKVRGHALTRTQSGQEIEYYKAGTKQETPEDTTPLHENFGKRAHARLYEIFISILIGVFFMVGTPLFGLPSFPLIGMAFIFCFPAYIIFPSQNDIIGSIKEGGDVSGRGWLLVPKSAFKITAYILIIAQTFAFNRLISLVIAFFFYFTALPGRYKTTQPAKAIEAWAKLGFGAYLAYLFFLTFGGMGLSGNNIASALGWMGAAFFITFPIQVEGDKDESKITVVVGKYKSMTDSGAFKVFDRGFFLVCMMLSMWFFVSGGGNLGDMIHIVFYLIFALSLLVGISAGPEARPAMGVMTIMIALFIFSTTYTGVVGQAIFGYWWPQVQSATESIFVPLDDMLFQAQTGMADAWLMITNPQAAIAKQQQDKQASVSKTTGSKRSIEVSRFELFSALLDPNQETLIGNIELENSGEFNADYINLDIEAFWKRTTASNVEPETSVGSLEPITCSSDSGSPVESTDSCYWGRVIYPTEIKFATFKFSRDGWGELGYCCPVDAENCDTPTSSCSPGAVYAHSGETVKVRASYNYNYNVNVSIPIDVIPLNEYYRLLQAREIKLEELISEYTGGPVKATIYCQRQPIRDGEETLIRVSLKNEGRGNITFVDDLKIYVPQILNDEQPIEIEASTFSGCTEGDTFGSGEITCTYFSDIDNRIPQIGPGEYRTVVFLIKPNLDGFDDQSIITRLITGVASYEYMDTKNVNIQVAIAPFGT
ncbi:MAG: hypothetical protein V1818_04425 [Candidatus Aenigmatarchaeota archaeon]